LRGAFDIQYRSNSENFAARSIAGFETRAIFVLDLIRVKLSNRQCCNDHIIHIRLLRKRKASSFDISIIKGVWHTPNKNLGGVLFFSMEKMEVADKQTPTGG
jgi:hypothetical protein